jgi:general secretion pathway protein E
MIGEIRDGETAEIAVQASLTGHMVFSTLHTNDAIGAITRLIDMGIEPFLVVSALRAVLAQRLVRRICQHCAESDPAGATAMAQLGDLPRRFPDLFAKGPSWRRGAGCRACQGTGFKGRVAIYEMVGITPDLHAAILGRGSSQDLQRIVREHGFRTLREDSLVKAWQGVTSIDEALRATGIGDE